MEKTEGIVGTRIKNTLTVSYYSHSGKYKIYIEGLFIPERQYLGFIAPNRKSNVNNYYIHYYPRRLYNKLTLANAIELVVETTMDILGTEVINVGTDDRTYWVIEYV